MKKCSSLMLIVLLFASCQSKNAVNTDLAKTDSTKYPYTLKKVHHWEMNTDSKNLLAATSFIKTFENLDTANMGKILADSVWLHLDGYRFKGTKLQFLKEVQQEFAKMSNFKIEMEDMESVINKDKSEEWVSLWYHQVSTTKDGKIDTVSLYNDIKLKNGKVEGLSEYVQHPMKK